MGSNASTFSSAPLTSGNTVRVGLLTSRKPEDKCPVIIGADNVIAELRERFPSGTRIQKVDHVQGAFDDPGMTTQVGLASLFLDSLTFGLASRRNEGENMWDACHSAVLLHTPLETVRLELYADAIRSRIGDVTSKLMTRDEKVLFGIKAWPPKVRPTATIDEVIDLLVRVKDRKCRATHWNCHHFAYYMKLLLNGKYRSSQDDYLGLLHDIRRR